MTFTVTPAAGCTSGTEDIDCTLDITDKSTLIFTLTSSDCGFTGNELDITSPITEPVFTDGCSETVGTEFHINSDLPFDAGTQLTFKFTQGVGQPGDPEQSRADPAGGDLPRLDAEHRRWRQHRAAGRARLQRPGAVGARDRRAIRTGKC